MINYFKNKKTHVYHDITAFGHYLAGVWEGDGYTHLKDKKTGKVSVHITMHITQVNYITKLLGLLQCLCNNNPVGSVHIRHDNNSCVLNIFTYHGLRCMIDLTRGKLRTPKAHHLNPVIDWLNVAHNTNLDYITYISDVNLSTPWFAGFVDADGCFGIDLSIKTRLKVACQFQINQRMTDPKALGLGVHDLFRDIAKELSVNLHTVIEKRSQRNYYAIKATSYKSKSILRRYFDTFPLLTSKFLDYQCWCKVDDLLQDKQNVKNFKQIKKLKETMNSSRRKFTWDHLCEL